MNTNKNTCVISCPIDCYSGYSARSRDLVKSIIESKKDEWDIKILPQRWGNCSWGFIEDNIEQWGFLNDYMLPQGPLTQQPDIWPTAREQGNSRNWAKYQLYNKV